MTENQFTDECSSHKYFTQTTNIIFELGLTAYEIALYMAIKRTAGQKGLCKKGTKRLALESGMSIGTVSSTKRKLCEPRKELEGKSLIRIESVVHESGGNGVDHIFITDIWDENHELFNKNKKKNTYSPHEPPYSPHEPKNNLNKNNLNKKDIPKGIYKEKSSKASKTIPKFVNEEREDTIPVRDEIHLTQEQIDSLESKYSPEMLEIMYDKLNLQHISIAEGVVKRKKPYTFSVFSKHSWLWDTSTNCMASTGTRKSFRETFKDKVKSNFKHGEVYNSAEYSSSETACSFNRGMNFYQVKWDDYQFEDKFNQMLKRYGISFGQGID